MNFLTRWLVTAVAAAAALWLVPGMGVVGQSTFLSVAVFALLLAIIDIWIKPVLQLLSLPVTVLTLGIFYLIVNTLLIYLAATGANFFGAGIYIYGFGSAFLASIIISIVSALMNGLVKA